MRVNTWKQHQLIAERLQNFGRASHVKSYSRPPCSLGGPGQGLFTSGTRLVHKWDKVCSQVHQTVPTFVEVGLACETTLANTCMFGAAIRLRNYPVLQSQHPSQGNSIQLSRKSRYMTFAKTAWPLDLQSKDGTLIYFIQMFWGLQLFVIQN